MTVEVLTRALKANYKITAAIRHSQYVDEMCIRKIDNLGFCLAHYENESEHFTIHLRYCGATKITITCEKTN